MSWIKHSALMYGANQATQDPVAVQQSPIGYFLNLNSYFPSNLISPDNHKTLATTQFGATVLMAPMQYNLQANFVVNVDWTMTNGAGNWTADPRLVFEAVTIDDTISTTNGAQWAIYNIFPQASWLVLGDDFSVTLSTSVALSNASRFSTQTYISGSQLSMMGTFRVGVFFDNTTGTTAGNTITITRMTFIMPFQTGVH